MKKNPSIVEDFELIPAARVLKFSSVIDTSFGIKFFYSIIEYFAKINTTTTGPSFIGFVFFVLFLLQTLIPSLLINSVDLWPSDSIITSIFRALCCFCDGPSVGYQEKRIYVSFSLAFLFLISFILICFRSNSFSKFQILTSTESTLMLFYFKYFLVFFLPLLLSGLPIAIYRFSHGDYSFFAIFVSIFVPIIYLCYVIFMIILIFPRILLENVPMHGWLPQTLVIPFITTDISSILSNCVGLASKKIRIVFPFLIFILNFFIGFVTIRISLYTKNFYTILASSVEFTASIISFIQFINLFTQKIQPEIIIIILFLLLIIFFLLIKYITERRVRSVLSFYDNLDFSHMSNEECQPLNKRYQSPYQFASDILLTIEYWHPIILSSKLFEFVEKKWPKSFLINFLKLRIISIFPSKNAKLMLYYSEMNHSSLSIFSLIYIKQCDNIIQLREVDSESMKKKIFMAQFRLVVLLTHLRRFWENILQKSITNFWEDVGKVNKVLSEVDSNITQLTRDHPNNEDVWIEYYRFTVNIKHNFKESNKIKAKIYNLLTQQKQQPDLPMKIAIQVYPNIQVSVKDFIEEQQAENQNEEFPLADENRSPEDMDETIDYIVSDYSRGFKTSMNSTFDNQPNENNETEQNIESKNYFKNKNIDAYKQMEIATQDLIEHSKLGNVLKSIIVCTVLIILSIVFFCLFSAKYTSSFTKRQKYSLQYLRDINLFYYHVSYFNLYILTSPLFITNYIKVDRTLMDTIAPNLFTTLKLLPMWKFDLPIIQKSIDDIKTMYSGLINSLYSLDDSDTNVKNMVYLIEYKNIYDGLTFGSTIDKLLTSVESLFNGSAIDYLSQFGQMNIYPIFDVIYSTLDEIISHTINYLTNFHANILKDINDLMVLSMLTLLLVVVSFVISHYFFTIQNEDITNSFLYFPNSENRKVITKFGHQLNIDPDLNKLSSLAFKSSDTISQKIFYNFVFYFSFIPFVIGCLIIYYFSFNFKSVTDETTLSISTLYLPFTYLTLIMEEINREYTNVLFSNSIYIKYDNAEKYLVKANYFLSYGMWNNTCSINLYLKRNEISGMVNYISEFNNLKVIRKKSLFELLITNDFPFSVDLLVASLKQFISSNISYKSFIDDERYLSLLYYFTYFSDTNRNKPYFKLVEDKVYSILDSHTSRAFIVTFVIVIIQVIAFILIIVSLLNKSIRIKKSLRFYQDLSPEVLSQNNNAMTLITTGKSNSDRAAFSFKNSDLILMSIPQGVFITNRDLLIIDYNQAFKNMVKFVDNEEILNLPLTQVVRGASDFIDYSWPMFVQHMTEIFSGARKPQFSESVAVEFERGKVSNLIVNAIGLINDHPAFEGESDQIDSVAVLIEDVTEETLKLKTLKEEKEEINKMISKVLPRSFIDGLVKSEDESISFVVQNATIGFISVDFQSPADLNMPEQSSANSNDNNVIMLKKFEFLSNVFDIFDNILSESEFSALCKVRTSSNIYMFAGGIFESSRKNDKIEVETCNFALKALKESQSFMQAKNKDVEIRIGIHSGGPVVAGAISVSNPAFQILGPLEECAKRLLDKCEPWSISVSRAVYENIFTSGFRIYENGEIYLKSGNEVQVYVVSPAI